MISVDFIKRNSKPDVSKKGVFYWIIEDSKNQIWFSPSKLPDDMILLNDNASIEEINRIIKGINKDIVSVNTKLDNLETGLSNLNNIVNTDYITLEYSIESVKSDLETKIGNCSDDLNIKIGQNSTNISDLKDSIEGLTEKVGYNMSGITDINSNLENLKSQLTSDETDIDDISDRLLEVEKGFEKKVDAETLLEYAKLTDIPDIDSDIEEKISNKQDRLVWRTI